MSAGTPTDRPSTTTATGGQWNLPAALAAWLLPGLGHYMLGERRRGSILAATILILWAAGLLIGGVTVIDHRENKPWFLGQMLLSPSVLMDQVHQRVLKHGPAPPAPPGPSGARTHLYEPSFGRVYEQGVLYTALAGLLNLLAVIDVLYRDPNRPRVDDDRQRSPASGVPHGGVDRGGSSGAQVTGGRL